MSAEKSVTSYLNGLVWDGTPRLSRWLIDYAGAEDTTYVRAVGRLMLVAAVRRVRVPGSEFAQLPVLVGPQGIGKSSALRVLAVDDSWFSNDLPGEGERFSCRWIVEACDLHAMGRYDVEKLKGLISTTSDSVRMINARESVRLARQFVLIGPTSGCFRGAVGNRRFLPVQVQRFDLDRLRSDRDQLWAEAVKAEALGESIHLELAETETL